MYLMSQEERWMASWKPWRCGVFESFISHYLWSTSGTESFPWNWISRKLFLSSIFMFCGINTRFPRISFKASSERRLREALRMTLLRSIHVFYYISDRAPKTATQLVWKAFNLSHGRQVPSCWWLNLFPTPPQHYSFAVLEAPAACWRNT